MAEKGKGKGKVEISGDIKGAIVYYIADLVIKNYGNFDSFDIRYCHAQGVASKRDEDGKWVNINYDIDLGVSRPEDG